MAARPLGVRPGKRAGIRTVLGLPAAALATMVGIVLVINAHVYGWPGVAAGIFLAAAGVALGVHCFRADSSAVPHPAAKGCPESGEIHE
ncbi:MAG: hypothetical protein OXT63_09630 [Gemmatimonadota bacterium]|nr:hypothetical protein [Gemmatimonadota bacterium]